MSRVLKVKAALVAALLVGGCLPLSQSKTTTVPRVERKIDEALPVGSTRENVEAWLTQQGIEYSFTDKLDDYTELKAMPDIDNYPTGIIAIVRDTDHSFFVTGSITLKFLFGPDGRLQKRVVRWIGTGL